MPQPAEILEFAQGCKYAEICPSSGHICKAEPYDGCMAAEHFGLDGPEVKKPEN